MFVWCAASRFKVGHLPCSLSAFPMIFQPWPWKSNQSTSDVLAWNFSTSCLDDLELGLQGCLPKLVGRALQVMGHTLLHLDIIRWILGVVHQVHLQPIRLHNLLLPQELRSAARNSFHAITECLPLATRHKPSMPTWSPSDRHWVKDYAW